MSRLLIVLDRIWHILGHIVESVKDHNLSTLIQGCNLSVRVNNDYFVSRAVRSLEIFIFIRNIRNINVFGVASLIILGSICTERWH